MRKVLFLMVMGVIIALMIFFSIAESKAQTGQNTRRWDLWSGSWDLFVCYNDSTTQDSLWFEQGDTLYTEAFKTWPFMSVEAVVVDTASATDSVKVHFKLLQSAENTTNVVKENFVQVKDLSWRSTSSLSESDTLTAVGRYMANITDETIYVGRWGRIMIIAPADSKKLTGNYVFLVVNGWHNFK